MALKFNDQQRQQQVVRNQDWQPTRSMESGETFIQRQKRLQGQRNQQVASQQPQTSQQGPKFADMVSKVQGGGAQPATPVQGDGKIPPPQPGGNFNSMVQSVQAGGTAQPQGGNQNFQGGTPQQQPAQPAPQQQPAPAPQPQPQATPQDPRVQELLKHQPTWTPEQAAGWVNRYYGPAQPAAQGAPTPATAAPPVGPAAGRVPTNTGPQAPGTPLQGMDLGDEKFATYQGSDFSNINTPQVGELPSSYAGTNFNQFAAPDQSGVQGATNSLLQRVLVNPESLSPEVQGMMKERNKEAALMMQQQGMQSARQNAAARGGLTGGSGLSGLEQAIRGDTMDSVIRSNRDVEVEAARTNMADRLRALGAGEAAMTGEMGRAVQGFGATLAGQQAQAGDNRAVSHDAINRAITGFDANMKSAGFDLTKGQATADERFKQYGSERSAQDAGVDRILKQFGINEAVVNSGRADKALNLQGELGRGGLNLDQQRINQQGSQFDKSHGLNVLGFLEGQRQHNNSMGFNWANLGQNAQSQLINQIMGMLR